MVNNIQEPILSSIQEGIKKIQMDGLHSSTIITEKAIKLLDSYLLHCKKRNSFSKGSLEYVLLRLVEAQPSMALIIDLANQLLTHLNSLSQSQKDIQKVIESLRNQLYNYHQSLQKADDAVSYYAVKQVSHRSPIATYSFSATVQRTIELLFKKNNDFNVFCSESRPKNEGINLAKTLTNKGISVSLMTDAGLFSHINKTKTVLIGADAITDKGIVNKIGSKPLIHHATSYGIEVYALCISHKKLPFNYQLVNESRKPANEIYSQKNNKINIINIYFDTTPLELFTGVITEHGICSPQEIRDQLHKKSLHPLLNKQRKTMSYTK